MSTPLTQNLGEKLQAAMGNAPKPARRNPRSGVDFDSEPVLMLQNTEESRDKNNEEAGTASKNTNTKNNRTETQMNQTTTNFGFPQNNGAQPETAEADKKVPLDQAAVAIAGSLAQSAAKVANEGIALKRPAFARRRAEGYTVAGAAIGVAGGAVLGTVLMGKFGTNPTNQDITNAGYASAILGGVVGGCTGNVLGSFLDDREAASKK